MEENKKLVWWVVIIIAVLAVAAFLLYYVRSTPTETPAYGITQPAPDSVSSIESDLNATNLNGLGSEVNDISKELAK